MPTKIRNCAPPPPEANYARKNHGRNRFGNTCTIVIVAGVVELNNGCSIIAAVGPDIYESMRLRICIWLLHAQSC